MARVSFGVIHGLVEIGVSGDVVLPMLPQVLSVIVYNDRRVPEGVVIDIIPF